MLDSTAVIITIEFLATIVILAGLIFWLDRKQTERLDRMDRRIDGLQNEMREGLTSVRSEMREGLTSVRSEMREGLTSVRSEMHEGLTSVRSEMRELDAKVDALGSKVDRMQGTLDVLVFGERGVPPPVARERAEAEERVEETVGD